MGRQMIFWLLAPFFQWIEYSRLYKNKTFIPKPRSSSLEGLFNKGSLVNLLFNCLHNATVLHIYFMIFSFKFQTIFKQSTCTMHIFWSQLNIDLFQVSNNLWSGLGFPEFLFCPVEYCSSRADPSVKVQSSNLAILKRDGKGMDNFFLKKRPPTPAKWFYFMQSNRVFDTEIYTFDSFKFRGVPPNRILKCF